MNTTNPAEDALLILAAIRRQVEADEMKSFYRAQYRADMDDARTPWKPGRK